MLFKQGTNLTSGSCNFALIIHKNVWKSRFRAENANLFTEHTLRSMFLGYTGRINSSLFSIVERNYCNTKKILWRESTPEFKDTHREKAPSSKTPALTKGINMGIW